jgi:hypothetical protein
MSPNTDKDNTLNNRRKKDASDGKHGNNQFGFIIDAFVDAYASSLQFYSRQQIIS